MKLNKMKLLIILVLVISLGMVLKSQAFSKDVYRYALIAGTNDGGKERVTLRYAVSDAVQMLKVLMDLGGVQKGNILFLKDPTKAKLLSAFAKIDKVLSKLRSKAERIEFIFYYSGHSDSKSLKLGNEQIYYKELREIIKKLNADVRIIILDSCASGALLTARGGKRVAPFLSETVNKMEGHAFITSSSVDENAQESDDIKAGFFTHNLISGLRGAADYSNDKKVTLNEAYQYAFEKTLTQSSQTLGGPQHPNYDIRLIGAGELVLTDLRRASATISIPKNVHGHVIVKSNKGNRIVETDKKKGKVAILALDAGKYDIIISGNNEIKYAKINIRNGSTVALSNDNLTTIDPKDAHIRGDGSIEIKKEAKIKKKAEHSTPVDVAFVYPLQAAGKDYDVEWFRFSLLYGMNNNVTGIDFSGIANQTLGDSKAIRFAGIANITHGNNTAIAADFGGIANITFGDNTVYGGQMAGITNFTTGKTALYGAQFAGIINYTDNAVFVGGGQGAGIANHSNGDLEVNGIQVAGILNEAMGNTEINGMQIAGIYNLSSNYNKMSGMQLASIFNYSSGVSTVNGVQAAGIFNYSKGSGYLDENSGSGFQLAFITNIKNGDRGEFTGFQLAGITNVTKDADFETNGFQFALFTNIHDSSRDFNGVQLASTVNQATYMNGLQLGVGWYSLLSLWVVKLQFSGTDDENYGIPFSSNDNDKNKLYTTPIYIALGLSLNIAKELHGAQVGLINIATKAKGVQIGVVNYANQMTGLQIGLVNIIAQGAIPVLPIANFSMSFDS